MDALNVIRPQRYGGHRTRFAYAADYATRTVHREYKEIVIQPIYYYIKTSSIKEEEIIILKSISKKPYYYTKQSTKE